MADFVFKLEEEAALEANVGGGSFGVLDTGIYDVTISHAAIDKTKNGNNVVNIAIKTDTGHETTIWGMCIDPTWASGAENYDYKKWQSLAALAGMRTGETVPFTLELSNGQTKQLVVFKELHGFKCKLAIQKKLDVYNGDVRESNVIYEFYGADGKTYAEKAANKDANRIGKVESRLSDYETKPYKALGKTMSNAPVDEPQESIFG